MITYSTWIRWFLNPVTLSVTGKPCVHMSTSYAEVPYFTGQGFDQFQHLTFISDILSMIEHPSDDDSQWK
jgi:hypothetical protein